MKTTPRVLTLGTLFIAATLAACVHRVHETAPAPSAVYVYPDAQPAAQDYRRRSDETLYTAEVQTVRAIAGNSGQRCWIERSDVAPPRPSANVTGAIVGGVIGGILGHQVTRSAVAAGATSPP